MKKEILTFLSAFILGLGAVIAQETPRADNRQENQKARIVDGVKSGELTAAETANVAKDQREIRRMERRAKADGKVTAKEKLRIEKKQDRASRKLARKKNNAVDRN